MTLRPSSFVDLEAASVPKEDTSKPEGSSQGVVPEPEGEPDIELPATQTYREDDDAGGQQSAPGKDDQPAEEFESQIP